ncbi:MAG: hypothetical protein FD149_1426 [Rhodospirillaceae bacterium]|nr:MAG: hypothetical protein FD149_1426 [Rhodospirillaceae bacterium]
MSHSTEFLYEFVRLGNVCKATAIDPVTMLEASIVGPAHFTRFTLAAHAGRKLQMLIRKRNQSRRPPGRFGLYV